MCIYCAFIKKKLRASILNGTKQPQSSERKRSLWVFQAKADIGETEYEIQNIQQGDGPTVIILNQSSANNDNLPWVCSN